MLAGDGYVQAENDLSSLAPGNPVAHSSSVSDLFGYLAVTVLAAPCPTWDLICPV